MSQNPVYGTGPTAAERFARSAVEVAKSMAVDAALPSVLTHLQCSNPNRVWIPLDPKSETKAFIVYPNAKSQAQAEKLFRDTPYIEHAIRCKRCALCRKAQMHSWIVRLTHELQEHELAGRPSCFVTLTYNDESLPLLGSLDHADFQLFMKRLRQRLSDDGHPSIRYFMCAEYGPKTKRAHYHCIIFGWEPTDTVSAGLRDEFGNRARTSRFLEDVWGKGFVTVGSVLPGTVRYVARYNLKKMADPDVMFSTRENAQGPRLDFETGEITGSRVKPYIRMSNRPGIGANWLHKHVAQLASEGVVNLSGAKFAVPDYYRKLIKADYPDHLEVLIAAHQAHVEDKGPVSPDFPKELQRREEFTYLYSKSQREREAF